MDTQYASEFLSDALKKHDHNVTAEVLYPIMGDLCAALYVSEQGAFLDARHDMHKREAAIQALVNKLRNVNCDEESLVTVLMGLDDQQRDAVLAALGAED